MRTEKENLKLVREIFTEDMTPTQIRIVELLNEMRAASSDIKKRVHELKISLKDLKVREFRGNAFVDKDFNKR